MKRILILLCLLVFTLCMVTSAFANEWGVGGSLAVILNKSRDYDGYTTDAKQTECQPSKTTDVAVMHKNYKGVQHDMLMAAVKVGSKWTLAVQSTTAVPQEGDGWIQVRLKKGRNGSFTLSNPHDGAVYTFAFADDNWYLDSADFVCDGQAAHLSWHPEENAYEMKIGEDSAFWSVGLISLQSFNISLMPQTVEEVLRLNEVQKLLPDGGPKASVHASFSKVKSGTTPVYSAPDPKSWRSGNGKAAVGLNGSFTVYATDGDWTLIEYDSSLKTHRIGYMKTSVLGKKASQIPDVAVGAGVQLTIREGTWMTDDPLSSQYPQFTLPAGTSLTVFSAFNPWYAYAEAMMDGQRVRGFVPLSSLY